MMLAKKIKRALSRAVKHAGSVYQLAVRTRVDPAIVARFHSGERNIENMTISTFDRLFPDMKVSFFGEDSAASSTSQRNTIDVGGEITGMIVQDGRIDAARFSAEAEVSGIDPVVLARKIRKSEKLTPEERLKFLDFLDEEL
ncbi:MAG: hypothetical protein PHS41_09435 [Victivallaceae bacterium]|nr:hypothetical protein [Victivallaceae bacterium]